MHRQSTAVSACEGFYKLRSDYSFEKTSRLLKYLTLAPLPFLLHRHGEQKLMQNLRCLNCDFCIALVFTSPETEVQLRCNPVALLCQIASCA